MAVVESDLCDCDDDISSLAGDGARVCRWKQKYHQRQYRMMNEVPTVLMIIVISVIVGSETLTRRQAGLR